jgi:hypothetical protein
LSRRCLWLSLAIAFAAAGCGTQGLVLQQPDQVRDVKPTDLSSTKAPVKISWTARPLGHGERYAVFVDQLPMPPGESLRSLADDTCKATRGCPNRAYYEQHFIYVTRHNQVKVAVLPLNGPLPVNDLYGLNGATIVILDRDGNRAGEEYWSTSFFVPTGF